jgi:hypothetical protein
LFDNPFVGFYNPISESQIPPKAARDAIRELDRINSRLITHQAGEPEKKPLMLALSNMCEEYYYPNAWASLPPREPAETHGVNKIKTEYGLVGFYITPLQAFVQVHWP